MSYQTCLALQLEDYMLSGSFFISILPSQSLILTLIQLWKKYTLIQFCGVRTDPGDYFKLNVISILAKGIIGLEQFL